MMDCKYITRDMLTHPVMVKVDDNPLDFSSARVSGRRESQGVVVRPHAFGVVRQDQREVFT